MALTWVDVPDDFLVPGTAARSVDIKDIRDNMTRMAEKDPGSPILNGKGAIEILTVADSSPWTVPAGVTRVHVTCIGGGGGGGGSPVLGIASRQYAGGGGGGATNSGVLTVVPASTKSFAVGAAGAGGIGAANGGTGGQTQFDAGTISANGGIGGTQSAIGNAAGGAGGSGSGGTVLIDGGAGRSGSDRTFGASHVGYSGYGGDSALAQGNAGQNVVGNGVSASSNAYGIGGPGAVSINVSAFTGGAGGAGLIILRY